MKQSRMRVLFGAVACGLLACSSSETPEEVTRQARSALTLTTVNQRVLGFESSDWAPSSGNSSTHSEGAKSLQVPVNGWTQVTSIALSTLGVAGDCAVASTASFDLQLPASVGWGEARLWITVPRTT